MVNCLPLYFKKNIFLLIKIWLTFLVLGILIPSSLLSMENDLHKKRNSSNSMSRLIHISPEAVDIQTELDFLKYHYPHISQPLPKINSMNDFQLAKQYFITSNSLKKILFEISIESINLESLKEIQVLCKDLVSYIEMLQVPLCSKYRSETDERELEQNFYETNCQIGIIYLTFLAALDFRQINSEDLQRAQGCVKEIKAIKETLSNSRTYRKLLQKQIEGIQSIHPYLIPLFDPGRRVPLHPPSRTSSKNILQRKDHTRHQILSHSLNSTQIIRPKYSFDSYYQVNLHRIFTELHRLTLEVKTYEEYLFSVQKLSEEYITLEKEGSKFISESYQLELPNESEPLDLHQLKNLYVFLSHRFSSSPKKSPIILLPRIIGMLIDANKLPDALFRTELLKELLLVKGELPEEFVCFRAGILALNGKPEEWNSILEHKRKVNDQRKAYEHQKHVIQIKKTLREDEDKKEAGSNVIDRPASAISQKPRKAKSRGAEPCKGFAFESYSNPHVNHKSEIVLPREKVKTRKYPQLSARGVTPIPLQTTSTEPFLPQPIIKMYAISKNAFKTYQKIRVGDWKFKRKDLCNLFEKLGCTIDISQGKGDHGKIIVPLNMTIEKEGHFVAAIPEFRSSQTSTLTIPNWDNKWDGRVPPYLTKSIIAALDYLGATDESVHKSNIQ